MNAIGLNGGVREPAKKLVRYFGEYDMRLKRNPHKYHGITYGSQKPNCKRGIHIWDEVMGACLPDSHYLVCDKCGLMVIIAEIVTQAEACERVQKGIYR